MKACRVAMAGCSVSQRYGDNSGISSTYISDISPSKVPVCTVTAVSSILEAMPVSVPVSKLSHNPTAAITYLPAGIIPTVAAGATAKGLIEQKLDDHKVDNTMQANPSAPPTVTATGEAQALLSVPVVDVNIKKVPVVTVTPAPCKQVCADKCKLELQKTCKDLPVVTKVRNCSRACNGQPRQSSTSLLLWHSSSRHNIVAPSNATPVGYLICHACGWQL